jgi:16S rRNA (guanine527-N7)-methyltransferase
VRAAVESLVARYGLPRGSDARLLAVLDLLASTEHAPSSVRAPREAVDVHLADSLAALELAEVRGAGSIADLGSGGGFPGIPLAIALPASRVTLVESNARRAGYLRRAVEVAGADRVDVVNVRIESWREGLSGFDLVVARALAPLPVVAEYAAPLLRPGGALVVWRGRRDDEAERAGAAAARMLGLEPAEPVRVRPFPGAEHRYLHLMSKVRETPAGFPRRPGAAVKRPLGGCGGRG